jgi:putative ABC transport system ATP-binding protein
MSVVEARELYRFYHSSDDETFALRGVSLTVDDGEVVAVIGPSGSGKSTLLNCLAGLDEPDGGAVSIGGERLTRRTPAQRDRIRGDRIGILLQSANLFDHLDVESNIRAAQSFGTRRERLEPRVLLADVGMGHRLHAFPSSLSGGEIARASLAVALANDPALLLADEPTGEVDREAEQVLITLLVARADRGCAVVVVTHSDQVAEAAHRIVRLADGKVVDD